jgi:hypothetical protein
MSISAKAAPPNSLILLVDSEGGEIPQSMGRALIASTASCIAVGCRAETDGETEFTMGRASEVGPGSAPAFVGRLSTPSHVVVLRSILGDVILRSDVAGVETLVRVWVNDHAEPDLVIVGID